MNTVLDILNFILTSRYSLYFSLTLHIYNFLCILLDFLNILYILRLDSCLMKQTRLVSWQWPAGKKNL
jgi:hypothetical protein